MKPPSLLRETRHSGPKSVAWASFFTQQLRCSPFSSGRLLPETDWTCQVPIVSSGRGGAEEEKPDFILTRATGRHPPGGNPKACVRPPMCQVGHLIDAGDS